MIRFAHSPGRPFFDRKVAEGTTKKEAVRALKRRISDAVYRQLLARLDNERNIVEHPATLTNRLGQATHHDTDTRAKTGSRSASGTT